MRVYLIVDGLTKKVRMVKQQPYATGVIWRTPDKHPRAGQLKPTEMAFAIEIEQPEHGLVQPAFPWGTVSPTEIVISLVARADV